MTASGRISPTVFALALLPLALLSLARAAHAAPHLFTREGEAMGTLVSFSVLTDDDKGAARAVEAGFDEIKRLEALMTTWSDTSDVSRVNAEAGIAPVHVSDETFEVIQMAQRTAQMSQGAFDISFYAMHGLWKFDEDLEVKVPSQAAIDARLPLVDYREIVIDPSKKTVFLKKKGMGIGLGGIAKGYAVDRAVAILRRAGFDDAIVQAGGDLMFSGSKGGKPWTAGIRDPRGARDSFFAVLKLEDHAFSTAGDYERYFFLDGKRYHHIIDPKTGYPATRSRSVTIYAPNAFLADAIDDAVFILGWQKGIELVDSMPDVGAVVVDDQGGVHVSKLMQDHVEILRPPTDAP
ncbi:MAG TPA: FAD:protein FMN transferase [Gammaproteobacteria bacterium]|nr:FAD:protein FMN transferase [Gammaproteobacteria bacterium]